MRPGALGAGTPEFFLASALALGWVVPSQCPQTSNKESHFLFLWRAVMGGLLSWSNTSPVVENPVPRVWVGDWVEEQKGLKFTKYCLTRVPASTSLTQLERAQKTEVQRDEVTAPES